MPRYEMKLKIGGHGGPDFSKPVDPARGKRPTRAYSAGDTVYDNTNFAEREPARFVLLRDNGPGSEDTPAPAPGQPKAPRSKAQKVADAKLAELANMEEGELLSLAEEKEVDVAGLTVEEMRAKLAAL